MLDRRSEPSVVVISTSYQTDEIAAATEAAASLSLKDVCLVLAFVPGGMDGAAVASALDDVMGGVPVFGCSTAGQITKCGYDSKALLLIAFPKKHFRCASLLLSPLNPLSTTTVAAKAQRHVNNFTSTAGWTRLGLIFADGTAKQEDVLISTLQAVLLDLPLFGGSAGDGLRFEQTYVLHKGACHSDAAVLLLLETDLEFQGIGFDHFLPSDTTVVITSADPEARKVFEINGAPAAAEYARLVGCREEDLSPQVFAENPLLVEHHDRHYVRAISGVDNSGGLIFLAAIDDGLVMTLGQGQAVLQTLHEGLNLKDEVGRPPDFILGFDCVLRKLEIEQKQLDRAVSEILQEARVYGFNTYGEQFRGLHMNQTFVGVAFFAVTDKMIL